MQSRLNDAVSKEAFTQDVSDRVIQAAGLSWNVSGIHVNAQSSAMTSRLSVSNADFVLQTVAAEMSIGRISVDQVVDQNVGGATVHIRIRASCGPITIRQPAARAEAHFSIDWMSGIPQTALAGLALGWNADSWTMSDFACEGPEGAAELLRTEVLAQLKDPEVFRPVLSEVISSELQPLVQGGLDRLRQPLSASTTHANFAFQIGALQPVATGVIAHIYLGAASAEVPSLPSAATLAALPTDRPALLGGVDVIQAVVNAELMGREDYMTLDLQTIPTFHSLMQNRLIQLFVWYDLTHFPSSYPFWLRLKNPKSLTLTHSDTSANLKTSINLYAIIQAYRDSKWWSWMQATGATQATVALSVANGELSYQTSVESQSMDIRYHTDYATRYRPGSFPKSRILSAFSGPQTGMSGSLKFDDLDLGQAGRYRVGGLKWLQPDLFMMTWNPAP